MLNKNFITLYKLVVAGVVLGAIVTQLSFGLNNIGSFDVTNFFSFFTIESNILAVLAFLVSSYFVFRGKVSRNLDMFRGATTAYMVITGIVYVLLLAGLEETLQTPIPWVNFVLHYAFPVIALADWFIDRPTFTITLKQGLVWLIFPIAYAAYSLIRGAIIGWYPYPFLNPIIEGGYVKVIIICGLIAVGAYGLTAALTAVRPRKY